MIDGLSNNELILRLDVTHFHTCDIWLAVYLQATTEKLGVYHIHAGLQTVRHSILSSAETILTLKNRESIHFAKFAHDTCADTFF